MKIEGDKGNTFECAICGGVFGKAWTDEEAQEEHNKSWPQFDLDECALICDVCFNKTRTEAN